MIYYSQVLDVFKLSSRGKEVTEAFVDGLGIDRTEYKRKHAPYVDGLAILDALGHAAWYYGHFLDDQAFTDGARNAHSLFIENTKKYISQSLEQFKS